MKTSTCDKNKFDHVFWEPDGSCVVMLASDWVEGLPPLTFKSAGLELGSLERLSLQENGNYYSYYKEDKNYVFALNLTQYPWLLEAPPRIYLATEFNGWGAAIGNSEWELKRGDSQKPDICTLCLAIDDIAASGPFRFKFVTEKGDWLDIPSTALNAVQSAESIMDFEFNLRQTGQHGFRFQLPEKYSKIGNERVVWDDKICEESYDLFDLDLLLTASTDLPLGAITGKEGTTFRLFAPRARSVHLAYGRRADQADVILVTMSCVDGVTWEVAIPENLSGTYYTFRVDGENCDGSTGFDTIFDILDPYAKACVGSFGPGIVVAPDRVKKVERPFQAPPLQDLVILEGHARDLIARAPIELTDKERDGFTGLRKWIESECSYLRELGVNAIELLPVQQIGDFINQGYHWGYMPVNYFSPESSYALCPEQGSQIEEFAGLVRTCHKHGLTVILDVVYNHVGEPYHLSYIDKHYYFQHGEDGSMLNWSGCGNDLRCDTPMARRLIIESLKYFIEIYDVDGFRFDLAELVGVEVLREIEVELKKIKSSVILIAEPWSFRGHIQKELSYTGFSAWNDGFRESITQYVCGKGTVEDIRYYLSGSPDSSRFIAQTINYTESHDDHCWIDRITECNERNGSSPTWLDQRRTNLMASLMFVSLGVPMLAQGQDFMRSKYGLTNTYQHGDVNALDYERRLIHSGTQAYFRDWILFRLSKSGKALRYEGALKEGYLRFYTTDGSSAIAVVFNADLSVEAPRLIYAINPHPESIEIALDFNDFGELKQISDHERFDPDGLTSAMSPISSEVLCMTPYSCALWLVMGE